MIIKPSKLLYCLLCGIILALVLHIIIIFALPLVSQNNAWHRISKTLKPYNFSLLSNKRLSNGKSLISNLDPLFMVAACQFNFNDGAIHIELKGQVSYWTLSIYDTKSANHYTLNDRNTNPEHLNALLIPEAKSEEFETNQTIDANGVNEANEKDQKILIKVPFNSGLAVLRVLRPDDTWHFPVTEFIENASCKPINNSKP